MPEDCLMVTQTLPPFFTYALKSPLLKQLFVAIWGIFLGLLFKSGRVGAQL